MLRIRPTMTETLPVHHRGGFLCVGAFREVFLISLAIAAVLGLMWQASVSYQSHLSSQWKLPRGDTKPVLAVTIDQDRNTLIALTFPGMLTNVSLDDGQISPQRIPEHMNSAVSSEKNSTTVMLAEWTEDYVIRHRVDVVRQDELILSEEFVFEPASFANVFVSKDGRIAMVITAEGHVVGWDVSQSRFERWEYKLPKSSPRCRLSADGNRLVIAPLEDQAFVCDARTGAVQFKLSEFGDGFHCRSIDWSRDGQRIAMSDASGGIHVFDADGGERVAYERIDFEFARVVVFSNDGQRVAAGGFDNIIRVWTLSKPGTAPIELKGQGGVIRAIAFTPTDETLIAGSLDGSLQEWSVTKAESIRKFF